MKDVFPWYYRPSRQSFSTIWSQGLFIFDTNVLLGIYSYPEKFRKALFLTLEKLEDRLWIPYQVGLEFHRTKRTIIKSSSKEFLDLKKKYEGGGNQINSVIEELKIAERGLTLNEKEIKKVIDNFRRHYKNLGSLIEKCEATFPSKESTNEIDDKIDKLFNGKIGQRPVNQDEVNNLVADGSNRFENNIPPGFKDKDKEGSFFDGSISYQSRYGDLILWKQILKHAKDSSIKHVLFITNEKKADWWDIDGSYTREPLPALVQEIMEVSDVETFWMYDVRELVRASTIHFPEIKISEQDIIEAKSVTDIESNKLLSEIQEQDIFSQSNTKSEAVWDVNEIAAMETWAEVYFGGKIIPFIEYPYKRLEIKGVFFGIETLIFDKNQSYQDFQIRLSIVISRMKIFLKKSPIRHFFLLISIPHQDLLEELKLRISALMHEKLAINLLVGVVIGREYIHCDSFEWTRE